MFKPGQALPLRKRRTWCPRMSRDGRAEFPRNISYLWTWQRPVHGLDSAGNRTRTGTLRDRAQSVFAFSPRQQSRPQTIHVRAQATALIVREQAAEAGAECPQTDRRRELSTSTNSSRLQSVHERGLAKCCPHRCITVSILPPVNFPVHIQTLPLDVLI